MMPSIKSNITVVTASTLVLLVTQSVQAGVTTMANASNLIKNPTFNLYAGTYCKLIWCSPTSLTGLNGQDPSVAIAPWRITSENKNFEVNSNKFWSGYGGSNWSMDLNGVAPYTIGQIIDTVPGATYSVSYFTNLNPCGPLIKTGFIQASGAALSLFNQSVNAWEERFYQFVATSNTVTLEIGSKTSGR